ncbi:MAG: hypothetical protein ACI959_000290 [Limisphaerales bacterium]|jgi:hypothetical protein
MEIPLQNVLTVMYLVHIEYEESTLTFVKLDFRLGFPI